MADRVNNNTIWGILFHIVGARNLFIAYAEPECGLNVRVCL